MSERGDLESGKQLDRLVFFSDAVFAIAITLLVLDIRIPEDLPADRLGEELISLWPKLLGYALSFWVIGIYWRAHHRIFGQVEYLNQTLITLNLVFLMSVAFMPFPASIIGEYGNTQAGVIIYAVSLMVTGLLMNVTSLYIARNEHLAASNLDRRLILHGLVRGFSVPALCVVVIALTFVIPQFSLFALLLMAFVPRIVIRLIDREPAGT